ncbi:IclR family transcriptional regulator [Cupriavidus phytorum]|uniref:IclR family transcriptional regulator n=2 Tax=Cupriavidus TaxID=106589 RepID=A0A975XCW6_9BURK|nr:MULTISPECIES: IclR family transcriptional regulator [Cupriavidus]PZX33740.1 IclR family transcriptional regulator [Cupriavidus alkaliphilus]SOY65835.1 IclR family transcriptional regulator [Cupriavidus taiwanensis]
MANSIVNTERIKPGKGKATPNRSLERGIAVLRAFRAGSSVLGNGEIAERTGLSRSTVSRLTQSLVETGMLEYIPASRAYRLGVPVLCMAHAMRDSSQVLKAATPMMVEVAMQHRINVGLAVAEADEMVYLESFRYNRRQSLRTVVSGQRIPMALTSLGRAHLATLSPEAFSAMMRILADKNRGRGWGELRRQIEAAVASVHDKGYCVASWQPQVVAIAAPMRFDGYAVHVLNVSIATPQEPAAVEATLAAPLMKLAAAIQARVAREA